MTVWLLEHHYDFDCWVEDVFATKEAAERSLKYKPETLWKHYMIREYTVYE